MADTLKIFNKTRSIVALARTGKKEYFLKPYESIEILANEVEDDPRLKAAIQKSIHWDLIETSIVGVPLVFPRDDTTYALDQEELHDYVETEREDIGTAPSTPFDCNNILVCYDSSIVVDNCGNVVCC